MSNAVKWTVINRVVTIGALVAAVGIALLGFVLGFWGSIELLIEDPLDPAPAVEEANPIVTLIGVVVALLVWQVGKTYAFFRTLPRASGHRAAAEFDHERVKSEVIDGLDDRLTKIEEDLAETKRSVHELKRTEHAAAFDEGGLAGSERRDGTTAADDSGQADGQAGSFTFGSDSANADETETPAHDETSEGSFGSDGGDDPFSSAETVRPVSEESTATGDSPVGSDGDDGAFDSGTDDAATTAGDDPLASDEDDPLA